MRITPKTEDWRDQANCRNVDPDTFFPIQITHDSVKKAFSYCKPCPVRTECLHIATIYQYEGIWGHSTHGQRKHVLKTYFDNDLSNFTLEDAAQMQEYMTTISVKMRPYKRTKMDPQ